MQSHFKATTAKLNRANKRSVPIYSQFSYGDIQTCMYDCKCTCIKYQKIVRFITSHLVKYVAKSLSHYLHRVFGASRTKILSKISRVSSPISLTKSSNRIAKPQNPNHPDFPHNRCTDGITSFSHELDGRTSLSPRNVRNVDA